MTTQKEAKTHLAHGIEQTVNKAQYDECVKTLLSDKQVLARIAKHRVEEFKDYEISEIIGCIEGEPEISKHPVYPGKHPMEAIDGMNSESKIPNEGEIVFDVRFYMLTREKERIKVIVNIEAQKSYYPGYDFESRAIVYCARMISEQIDREFTTDDYKGLKKVYSIWIFFDAPKKDSDTITEYFIQKRDVYGHPVEGGKYDYICISFIRLSHADMEESKDKLIHMLSTLFSEKMDANEKKKILTEEYQMQMTKKLEGGIHSMCNVGEGLEERATARGYKKGMEQGRQDGIQQGMQQGIQQGILVVIKTMRKYGANDDEIAAHLAKEFQISMEEAKSYV